MEADLGKGDDGMLSVICFGQVLSAELDEGGTRTDEDRRRGRPRVVHAAGGTLRLLPGPGAPAERRGSGGGNRRGSHRMGRVPLPRAATAGGSGLLRRVLL